MFDVCTIVMTIYQQRFCVGALQFVPVLKHSPRNNNIVYDRTLFQNQAPPPSFWN